MDVMKSNGISKISQTSYSIKAAKKFSPKTLGCIKILRNDPIEKSFKDFL
jgi:hypothetical protein